MTRSQALVGLAASMAASFLVACNYDFSTPPEDASLAENPATQSDGGAEDAGRDAGRPPLIEDAGQPVAEPDAALAPGDACTTSAECLAVDALPTGCAEVACESGACVYRALDRDGDGARAAACSSARVAIETGSDCDDGSATVAPGLSETCNAIDDDCDAEVDEDIAPFDELPDCFAGDGVCKRAGKPTCVAGQPAGCSALPGEPEGPDFPYCDGQDHDCNGVADEACPCVAGQTRDCVQRCGRFAQRCTSGTWPACDANGGTAPSTYCYDADGDGYLSSGSACRAFCPAGSAGSGENLNGDARWRTPGGPLDCDDGNPSRFPGNPDARCDGTDQDCSGGEPDASCGHCAAVACGGQCPRCQPGFADLGRNFCEARGAWGAEVAFGDGVTGPAPGGFDGGAWVVPNGSPGNGHVEVHLQYDGPCCALNDDTTAVLRCSNGHEHGFRARDYGPRPDVVSYYVDVAPGTQCYLDRISNRKSICIGHCIRRHWVNAWSDTPSCI